MATSATPAHHTRCPSSPEGEPASKRRKVISDDKSVGKPSSSHAIASLKKFSRQLDTQAARRLHKELIAILKDPVENCKYEGFYENGLTK